MTESQREQPSALAGATGAQPPERPGRPAQGIAIAVLLSAPVWIGLGIWIYRLGQP